MERSVLDQAVAHAAYLATPPRTRTLQPAAGVGEGNYCLPNFSTFFSFSLVGFRKHNDASG